jgi:hypothetical protein
MKERPILFSAPMVHAIIDDRKTQTRRVIKGRDIRIDNIGQVLHRVQRADGNHLEALACPYGQPGDRLWVRETWSMSGNGPFYRTDVRQPETVHYAWKPSIFMPRWASRITLKITAVRAERLQDISEEDAIDEGCDGMNPESHHEWSAVDEYRNLWDSINSKTHPWDTNPYVWVITFKRI